MPLSRFPGKICAFTTKTRSKNHTLYPGLDVSIPEQTFIYSKRDPGAITDTFVCAESGMGVAYMCDALEFLVFRENVTELEPGELRSTGFGRLRLFDKLNGTECLNIALRISPSAGSVDGPIRVSTLLRRIINDASVTDQEINKLVSERGRSEMSIDALVLIIAACVLAVLLYILGHCMVYFSQVLPMNSLGGLSKIYDDDANQRGSSSHPIHHVTLGITEPAEEHQHFGSCKVGAQVVIGMTTLIPLYLSLYL
jgi:hypothetical protein